MSRNLINAIVATLAFLLIGGLILLGIERIRRKDNQTKCQNNLRQIGLAIHSHDSTFNRLPAGTIANPWLPPSKRLSWLAAISNFLESSVIYPGLASDKPWDDAANRFAAIKPMPVFRCPFFDDQPPTGELYPTSYIGIAGLGADAAELPIADPRAGVFGYDRKLTLDGKTATLRTSSLLAVIETTQMSESCITGGPATVRGFAVGAARSFGDDCPFGELGGDGANCLFLDGSARFIRASIDANLLKQLATISGSNIAVPPE
jgi:prepilin-type processing-associated H-X9-DG protein